MNIGAFTWGLPKRLDFSKNMLQSIFGGFKCDLYIRHTSALSYLYENANIIESYADCTSHIQRLQRFYDILVNVSKYDIFIINSFGCKQIIDVSLIGNIEFSEYIENNDNNEYAITSWLIAAHIVACKLRNIPYILYSFDPELDYNYGEMFMFSFVTSKKTRYIPFLEASVRTRFDKSIPIGYIPKSLDFCYGASLSTYDFKFTYRHDLHQRLIDQFKHDAMSHIYVETMGMKWRTDIVANSISCTNENDYFKVIQQSKYTLVPPNYTGICISMKRATDAIVNGSIPIFIDTKLAKQQLPECWLTICNKYGLICEPELLHKLQHSEDLRRLILYDLVWMCNDISMEDYFTDYIDKYNNG